MHPPRPPTVELVIFDCDGVLVDSEVLAFEVEAGMLAALGVEVTPAELSERYAGLQPAESRRRMEERWGVRFDDALLAARDRRLEEALTRRLAPVAGIGTVLDRLVVPCCVASSSSPKRIAISLARTGLGRHFGAAVFSAAMVERGKPAPDLFLHAAAAMGAAPAHCLVVEDSAHGVAAGLAAGMEVVAFAGASHCGPAWVERLRGSGASEVVASAGALARALAARGVLSPAPAQADALETR